MTAKIIKDLEKEINTMTGALTVRKEKLIKAKACLDVAKLLHDGKDLMISSYRSHSPSYDDRPVHARVYSQSRRETIAKALQEEAVDLYSQAQEGGS